LHPPKSYRCLDPFLNFLLGKVRDALGEFSHVCPLNNFWGSLPNYSLESNLVLDNLSKEALQFWQKPNDQVGHHP
jgi:hypothetical protein